MATVKKASTATKKPVAGKKTTKKVTVAKKAPSKSTKVAKKETSAVKKVAVSKGKPVSPKKKVSINKPAKKKVVSKAPPAKKVVTAPTKPTAKKAVVDKKATVPVKTSSPKETTKKEAIKNDKVSPKAKGSDKKTEKSKVENVIIETVSKPGKGKKEKPNVVTNPTTKPEDKLEPLQAKAQKVMKELEETMDLSKVRPRIQAGTTPTPPARTVIRMKEPPLKLVEPTNTTKVKFQLEFEFRSSPKILFNCLSDSSGLAGWFADEVKTKDSIYTFVWEGGESYAKLVGLKDLHLVRFQWLDDTDGTYFQFEIKEDDITTDIALEITDFANPGEKETAMRLWESQVQKLRMLLGSL